MIHYMSKVYYFKWKNSVLCLLLYFNSSSNIFYICLYLYFHTGSCLIFDVGLMYLAQFVLCYWSIGETVETPDVVCAYSLLNHRSRIGLLFKIG